MLPRFKNVITLLFLSFACLCASYAAEVCPVTDWVPHETGENAKCRPNKTQVFNVLAAGVYIGDCVNGMSKKGKKTAAVSCVVGAKMLDESLGLGIFEATGLDSIFGDEETNNNAELMERLEKVEARVDQAEDRLTKLEIVYSNDKLKQNLSNLMTHVKSTNTSYNAIEGFLKNEPLSKIFETEEFTKDFSDASQTKDKIAFLKALESKFNGHDEDVKFGNWQVFRDLVENANTSFHYKEIINSILDKNTGLFHQLNTDKVYRDATPESDGIQEIKHHDTPIDEPVDPTNSQRNPIALFEQHNLEISTVMTILLSAIEEQYLLDRVVLFYDLNVLKLKQYAASVNDKNIPDLKDLSLFEFTPLGSNEKITSYSSVEEIENAIVNLSVNTAKVGENIAHEFTINLIGQYDFHIQPAPGSLNSDKAMYYDATYNPQNTEEQKLLYLASFIDDLGNPWNLSADISGDENTIHWMFGGSNLPDQKSWAGGDHVRSEIYTQQPHLTANYMALGCYERNYEHWECIRDPQSPYFLYITTLRGHGVTLGKHSSTPWHLSSIPNIDYSNYYDEHGIPNSDAAQFSVFARSQYQRDQNRSVQSVEWGKIENGHFYTAPASYYSGCVVNDCSASYEWPWENGNNFRWNIDIPIDQNLNIGSLGLYNDTVAHQPTSWIDSQHIHEQYLKIFNQFTPAENDCSSDPSNNEIICHTFDLKDMTYIGPFSVTINDKPYQMYLVNGGLMANHWDSDYGHNINDSMTFSPAKLHLRMVFLSTSTEDRKNGAAGIKPYLDFANIIRARSQNDYFLDPFGTINKDFSHPDNHLLMQLDGNLVHYKNNSSTSDWSSLTDSNNDDYEIGKPDVIWKLSINLNDKKMQIFQDAKLVWQHAFSIANEEVSSPKTLSGTDTIRLQ